MCYVYNYPNVWLCAHMKHKTVCIVSMIAAVVCRHRLQRRLLAVVVLAGLGLVALPSVCARVLADRLKLHVVQVTPEHLGLALVGMVHAGLHCACSMHSSNE